MIRMNSEQKARIDAVQKQVTDFKLLWSSNEVEILTKASKKLIGKFSFFVLIE